MLKTLIYWDVLVFFPYCLNTNQTKLLALPVLHPPLTGECTCSAWWPLKESLGRWARWAPRTGATSRLTRGRFSLCCGPSHWHFAQPCGPSCPHHFAGERKVFLKHEKKWLSLLQEDWKTHITLFNIDIKYHSLPWKKKTNTNFKIAHYFSFPDVYHV